MTRHEMAALLGRGPSLPAEAGSLRYVRHPAQALAGVSVPQPNSKRRRAESPHANRNPGHWRCAVRLFDGARDGARGTLADLRDHFLGAWAHQVPPPAGWKLRGWERGQEDGRIVLYFQQQRLP